MSFPIFTKVYPTGIAPVCFSNGASKSIFCFRHGNQMDMVRHQAPRPYFYLTFLAPFGHEINIGLIVIITEEGLLAAVAALGDVVGDAGGYNSSNACHVARIAENWMTSIKYTVTRTQPEEMLQGLLEHRTAFENLQPNCFEELFAKELFDNPYLGRFGRTKMTILLEGLPLVQTEQQGIEELQKRLIAVDQEERLYLMVLELVRHRVRNFYSSYATKAEQDVLRREVLEELKARKKLAVNLPDHVFQETVTTIQKEAVYLQSLLPTIIAEKNAVLREDFLANAGLDRFYVEELEREYYEQNGLDLEEMYQIRQGL
jgi:hypothetical protein